MSISPAGRTTRKPNTFRLPDGFRPEYVLVPGIDPDGGLVAVFRDGSYSPSWMPDAAQEALVATVGKLVPRLRAA